MAIKIYDVNNNDALVQTWESIENIFIILDFNGNDPEHPKDKERDIIKFKNMETKGWKGIYAENIKDAKSKLYNFLHDNKVNNLVVKSHGGFVIGTDNNGFVFDNNSKRYILASDLDIYSKVENQKYLQSGIKENIEYLLDIIKKVNDDKNFVLASCRSAFSNRFIGYLQSLSGNRINMYGFTGLTKITYNNENSKNKTIQTEEQAKTAIIDGNKIINGKWGFVDSEFVKHYPKTFKTNNRFSTKKKNEEDEISETISIELESKIENALLKKYEYKDIAMDENGIVLTLK